MASDLTPFELRILRYLDQHGRMHRSRIVVDLASPNSKVASMGGRLGGSNGAAPLIVGKWCRRMIRRGLIAAEYSRDGFYQFHMITPAGRQKVRNDG